MRTAVIEALRSLRAGLAAPGRARDRRLHRRRGADRRSCSTSGLPTSCRLHFARARLVGQPLAVDRDRARRPRRRGDRATSTRMPSAAARRLIDRTRVPIADQRRDRRQRADRAGARAPARRVRGLAVRRRGQAAGPASSWCAASSRTARGSSGCGVAPCRAGDGNPAIVALFGRERVADLEARGFAGDRTDAEIERTGLAFQIATRFTLVDRDRRGEGGHRAGAHDNMPQALPYGTTAAAFGLREAAPRCRPRLRGITQDPPSSAARAWTWTSGRRRRRPQRRRWPR